MSGIAPIKFVAIGGGTGLSTLLQGLKPYIAPLVSSVARPSLNKESIYTTLFPKGMALERAFAS